MRAIDLVKGGGSMSSYNEYLYIDFENVQDVNVKFIKETTKVKIIVGQDQKNIPFDLVTKTQKFGDSVEWIKVEGKGKNALDFFIAFYIGKASATEKDKKFTIYSKDTGYDPLIEHLRSKRIDAKRIVSFQELEKIEQPKAADPNFMKAIELLSTMKSIGRPKRRKTLSSFIGPRLIGVKQNEINNIIEELFIKKYVYEENGIIKYSLPKLMKK